ncbi:hypothetical protein D3C76_1682870 [compost metagenome]
MIQKKAMGSFNCSFMNMEVREKTLGKIFLVIGLCFSGLLFFILLLFVELPIGIKWCCKD